MSPQRQTTQSTTRDTQTDPSQAQYIVLISATDTGYTITPTSLTVPAGATIQWHCNLEDQCDILFPSAPFFPVTVSPFSSSPVFTISQLAQQGVPFPYSVQFQDGKNIDPEIIIEGPPSGGN